MKTFAAILMVLIMLFLSLPLFSQSEVPLNNNTLPLKTQLGSYVALTRVAREELNKIDRETSIIFHKFGSDVTKMDDVSLNQYIKGRGQYYAIKQSITDDLTRIYYPEYKPSTQSVDEELESALKIYEKKCNLIEKITEKCLDSFERNIFQAIYLDQRIESVEAVEMALFSELNRAADEEQDIAAGTLRL